MNRAAAGAAHGASDTAAAAAAAAEALIAAVALPCLAMVPELTIVAVNQAYLTASGRRREELLGCRVVADPVAEPLTDRQRQFTADASHELRTPLAALRVRVEEAQLHPGDIDLPDLLEHVSGDLDRLETVVDDLLLLRSLDAGQGLELLDLTSLAAETVAAQPPGGRRDVRLDLERGVTVRAAPRHLTRLLADLLDNARRHAAREVTVTLHRTAGHAELAVADDGLAVPSGERERVFQRVARLDTVRRRDRGGAGLGLATAREIAAAHRGTLEVEVPPGGGARFVLRLPLAG
ncbi:HAMP domain-containing sensor histidine kinase [Nonomuraea sp. NPDC050202]|uniref:sensor histidine kinase n=1 Tax=Nonomuraea sp. NPDC050202 TaxID=3155035 RepID=UPI0033E40708